MRGAREVCTSKLHWAQRLFFPKYFLNLAFFWSIHEIFNIILIYITILLKSDTASDKQLTLSQPLTWSVLRYAKNRQTILNARQHIRVDNYYSMVKVNQLASIIQSEIDSKSLQKSATLKIPRCVYCEGMRGAFTTVHSVSEPTRLIIC